MYKTGINIKQHFQFLWSVSESHASEIGNQMDDSTYEVKGKAISSLVPPVIQ